MKRARCGGSRGDVLPSSGGTPVWEPESVPSPASSMDAGGLLGSAAGRGGAGDDIHPLDADPGNEATAGTAADAFGSAPKRARAQPVANTEDAVVVDTIHARAAFAFLDRAAAVFSFGGAKLRDVQYAILRLPSSLKAAFVRRHHLRFPLFFFLIVLFEAGMPALSFSVSVPTTMY